MLFALSVSLLFDTLIWLHFGMTERERVMWDLIFELFAAN